MRPFSAHSPNDEAPALARRGLKMHLVVGVSLSIPMEYQDYDVHTPLN